MKNTQKLIGFLAAILNIISSSLFWYAAGKQGIDQVAADASTGLGNGFFVAALVLWAAYVIVLLASKHKR